MKTEDEILAKLSAIDETRKFVIDNYGRLDAYTEALCWVLGKKK